MALFNNAPQNEKEEKKAQEIMNRFGLDNLSEDDYKSCQKIITDLSGLGLLKFGMLLSFSKNEERCKVGYLSAMVEQNWIVIRQLNEVNQRLDWIMRKMSE